MHYASILAFLDFGSDQEGFLKPKLNARFKHCFFLVRNIHLYLESLGLLHLGQALCNHNHLRGPSDIIIGLLELSCLGFQSL